MIYNAAVIQKHIYIAFHYDMIYNTSSNILIDPLFFLGKEEGDAYEGTFHGCIFNIIYFTCKEVSMFIFRSEFKRKRNYIYFALLLLSLLIILPTATVVGSDNAGYDTYTNSNSGLSDEVLLALKQEEPAQESNDIFKKYLAQKGYAGDSKYPDDIAGVYIESNQLVIAVTGDDYEEYASLFPPNAPVRFLTRDYSYNFLAIELQKLEKMVQNWETAYVNQKNNSIIFGFSENSDIHSTYSAGQLSDLIVNNASLSNERYEFPSYCRYEMTPPILNEVNLWGGDPLNTGGTLGGTGYWGTTPAIVTTRHSASTGYVVSYVGPPNSYSNPSRIGTVSYAVYGAGDYCIVPLSQTTNTIVNRYFGPAENTSNPISISGTSSPAVGATIFKYGTTSGWARLRLEATNVSFYNGVKTLTGMTKASIIDGTSKPGDSGGPYFTYNTSTSKWYIAGIHAASNNPTGGTTTYFTPISKINSNFRFLY